MVEVPDVSVQQLKMDLTSGGEGQTAQNTVVQKFKCTPKKCTIRSDEKKRQKYVFNWLIGITNINQS